MARMDPEPRAFPASSATALWARACTEAKWPSLVQIGLFCTPQPRTAE